MEYWMETNRDLTVEDRNEVAMEAVNAARNGQLEVTLNGEQLGVTGTPQVIVTDIDGNQIPGMLCFKFLSLRGGEIAQS